MSLNPTKFRLAEYDRNMFSARPEHGTDIEAFMQPEYWAHIAAQCKVFDQIEVIPESGEYYMLFLVVAASRTGLRVKPIVRIDLSDEDEIKDRDLDVTWKGPVLKWCVTRSADKAVIYDKFASREEAAQKLAEHISAKAA